MINNLIKKLYIYIYELFSHACINREQFISLILPKTQRKDTKKDLWKV